MSYLTPMLQVWRFTEIRLEEHDGVRGAAVQAEHAA